VSGADLGAALDALVTEALRLRHDGKLPTAPAAPVAVLDALLDVRARLDRLEELLTQALRVRAGAHEAAALATATAEDAWDSEISRLRNAKVRPGDEYSTARERHAQANLGTLELRRAARQAEDASRRCERAVEVIRVAHRGLDGVRGDLLAWLRATAFESNLDR